MRCIFHILIYNSCLFRLAETKSSVVKALADDFDTQRAIGAVMNLVHHGNRQLQPVSTVTFLSQCTRDSWDFIKETRGYSSADSAVARRKTMGSHGQFKSNVAMITSVCLCVCVCVCLCAQADGVARSPAVFGAMVSYMREVLDMFGVDLLHGKVTTCG